MTTALDYLIFDYSEDDEGTATWDAMATVRADQFAPLQAEVLQVLCWADAQFPRQRGAIDEGAAWDFDLSVRTADQTEVHMDVDLQAPALRHATLKPDEQLTLTLTLTGRSAFAQALVHMFDVE